MKRRLALLLCLLSLWTLPLAPAPTVLRHSDIHRVMERLFSFHIENKDLTPVVARRCFKLYIEQFDPDKCYLLDSEVLPILQMDDAEIASVIQRMLAEDYSDLSLLNETIQQAIIRSQKMRQGLQEEFKGADKIEAPATATPAHYAKSEGELKERMRNRMGRFYQYHETRSDLSTPERKEKLFSLFDQKARRYENNYLYLKTDGAQMERAQMEHQFSLRVLKAFAKSLDTHSSFFSPEEAHEMRLSLEKQFEGVGIILFESIDGVIISELVKGSPAEQSGKIKVNDVLVEIDGKSTVSATFDDVLDWLKKSAHREIILGFNRFDPQGRSAFFRVNLVKRPIVMNDERLQTSWERFGDGIIGKISLYSFYENNDGISSEKDIREAINAFKKVGQLYGLILDLRENSGGFLSQAVKVAGLFISNGVVVISKYGQGEIHYLRNIVGRSYFNGPLVVLTSKMSASASEIVAQALQDYGVGIVVGDERTFGKGSIQYQTVTDENADLFFKVTVGKYYTPSGRTTQIEGVKADIVVPTYYAPYNIGERYLEYPLTADRVEPAFIDPLSDLDSKTKRLFQRKYMPYLQRVVSFWKKSLSLLKKNSEQRIAKNPQYQQFLKNQESVRSRLAILPPNSIDEAPPKGPDLQMAEAVNIVMDMIILETEAVPAAQTAKELLETGTD